MPAAANRSRNLDAGALNLELRTGVAVLGASLTGAVILLHMHASPAWRALLLLPFFVGFYGLFAGLTGVCSLSALSGRRLTRSGSERIATTPERRQLRRAGVKVLMAVITA